MGHALDHTLQDILVRWKRMDGYETLWQPGTDHASIATEVKVVEKIRKEACGFFFLLIAWGCKSTNIAMSDSVGIATDLVVGVSFNGMNDPI